MNWISKRIDKEGNLHDNSLPRETMNIIEKLIPDFCNYLEKKNKYEFEVYDLIKYTKININNVIAYKSDQKVTKLKEENLGYSFFDAQNVCYHLSSPDSFWIEDCNKNKKIILFERLEKMTYQLKHNWKECV